MTEERKVLDKISKERFDNKSTVKPSKDIIHDLEFADRVKTDKRWTRAIKKAENESAKQKLIKKPAKKVDKKSTK